jgi:hypothetical protein
MTKDARRIMESNQNNPWELVCFRHFAMGDRYEQIA